MNHQHEPVTHHRVDQAPETFEAPDLEQCDEYTRCAVCGLSTDLMRFGESLQAFKEATGNA